FSIRTISLAAARFRALVRSLPQVHGRTNQACSPKEFPMKRSRKKMVLAVFQNRYDAERAFDFLYTKGYRDNEINVLMTDQTRANFYPDSMRDEDRHEAGTRATEGMGVGGAIGAAVGATLA